MKIGWWKFREWDSAKDWYGDIVSHYVGISFRIGESRHFIGIHSKVISIYNDDLDMSEQV